jgi:copper transport protein
VIAALAGLIFGLLVALVSPARPASAHAALLSTQPQSGAVLAEAPAEAVLTFSEPVRIVSGKIHIFGPDGKPVDGGKPATEGVRLRIPMMPSTERGTYLISYRVISADSHPISGGIPFSIGAPSTDAPNGRTGGARTDATVAVLLGSARYLGYLGLVLIVGPAMFLAQLWPRRLSRRGPVRTIMVGIGLLTVSTLAEQYLQAPYQAGTGLLGAGAEDLREAFDSRFGAAHLVRVGVIAALTVLLPLFVNRPADAPSKDAPSKDAPSKVGWSDRVLVAVLVVVGLATWPISGHAAATSVPVLTTVADAAHLGAMAVWMGGLVALFGFLFRQANPGELAAVLPVWSRWAMTAVSVLVVAGTAQALVSLGSVGGLFETTYGRLLLIKIGLLALVLVVAWSSRRLALVLPRAVDAAGGGDAVDAAGGGDAVDAAGGGDALDAAGGGDAESVRQRLRRSVFLELVGILVVVALASTLAQTTPARAARQEATSRDTGQYNTGQYDTTLTTKLYSLQVQVEPEATGANNIHLYAFAPGGAALDVKEWKATAALPAQGIEPVEMPVLPVTGNHAVAQAQLPTPGTWELRFTLRTTDIDAATVVAEVPIK